MRIKPIGGRPRKVTFSKKVGPGQLFYVPVKSKAPEVGNQVRRLAYSRDELIASIGNSIKLHDHEIRESRTLLGRVFAIFAQAKDPDWIEIDGRRLVHLFQLSQTKPSVNLSVSETYYVEVDGLRQLLTAVSN